MGNYKNVNNDQNISVLGAIMLYRTMLRDGRIKADGPASKRLEVLTKRYDSGEKHFKT